MMNRFLHWVFRVPLVWVRIKHHEGWGAPRLMRVFYGVPLGFYVEYPVYEGGPTDLPIKESGEGAVRGPYARDIEYEWRPYRTKQQRTNDEFKLPLGFDIHTISERLEKS